MTNQNPYQAPKKDLPVETPSLEASNRQSSDNDSANEVRENVKFTAQMIRFVAGLSIMTLLAYARNASNGFSWFELTQSWSSLQWMAIIDAAIAISYGIVAYNCWQLASAFEKAGYDQVFTEAFSEANAYVWMSVILVFILSGSKIGYIYYEMGFVF